MTHILNRQVVPIAASSTQTLELPGSAGHPQAAAANGDRCRFEFAGTPDATCEFQVGAGDMIEDPYTAIALAPGAPLIRGFSRFNFTYVYRQPQNLWAVISGHRYRTDVSGYQIDGGPFPTLPFLNVIPVQYVLGDQERFSVEPDGTLKSLLTFSHAFPINASIHGTMQSSANNQEIQLHMGLLLTGTGQLLTAGDTLAFQTSRIGIWEWQMSLPASLILPAADDIISLVANHDAISATMTAQVDRAGIVIEGS